MIKTLLLLFLVQGAQAGILRPGGNAAQADATNLSGTVPVGSGGTGATSLTQGGVLYGNGTSAVSASATMQTGSNGSFTLNGASATVIGGVLVSTRNNGGYTLSNSQNGDNWYWWGDSSPGMHLGYTATGQTHIMLDRSNLGVYLGGNSLVVNTSSVSVNGAFGVLGSTLTATSNGWIAAPSQAGACVSLNVGQATVNNAGWTVYFGNVQYNNGPFFNPASSATLTVPAGGGGFYQLSGGSSFANNGTGVRLAYITVNGTAVVASDNAAGVLTSAEYNAVSKTQKLSAGDTIQLVVDQSSGGPLNLNADDLTFLWLMKPKS